MRVAASDGGDRPEEAQGATTVRALLERLDLLKYADLLIDEGFDSLAALRALTLEDLLAMGLKRGHARLLLQQTQSAQMI